MSKKFLDVGQDQENEGCSTVDRNGNPLPVVMTGHGAVKSEILCGILAQVMRGNKGDEGLWRVLDVGKDQNCKFK